MTLPDRSESIRIRVSTEEKRLLSELAEAEGLTVSDFIRVLVRREHQTRFTTSPIAAKRRAARH